MPTIARALVTAATASIDGKRLRALDPVLRARRLDVEHGLAQVAVLRERLLDHLLQPRLAHELAPRHVGRVAVPLPPGRLRGDRRRGALVVRRHRGAPGQPAHGQRR